MKVALSKKIKYTLSTSRKRRSENPLRDDTTNLSK